MNRDAPPHPASPRSRQEGELSSVDWYIYRLFSISSKSVIQSRNFAHERQRFGLRWQLAEAKRSEDWSAAATPLSVRPGCVKSGVAPALAGFPPQSKIRGCGVSRSGFIRVHPWLRNFAPWRFCCSISAVKIQRWPKAAIWCNSFRA